MGHNKNDSTASWGSRGEGGGKEEPDTRPSMFPIAEQDGGGHPRSSAAASLGADVESAILPPPNARSGMYSSNGSTGNRRPNSDGSHYSYTGALAKRLRGSREFLSADRESEDREQYNSSGSNSNKRLFMRKMSSMFGASSPKPPASPPSTRENPVANASEEAERKHRLKDLVKAFPVDNLRAAGNSAQGGRSSFTAKRGNLQPNPSSDAISSPAKLAPVPHSARAVVADQEGEEDMEPTDLMIGEIEDVDIVKEMHVLGHYVLMSVIIFVPCLIAHYAMGGATSIERSTGMNLLWWALFIVGALLSLPLFLFLGRAFAYFLTHRLSFLLYRGNSFFFLAALHSDIFAFLWSLAVLLCWNFIITADSVSTSVYTSVQDILACILALLAGILIKNFLTLVIATRSLWRPYLRRVSHNIFAQFVLLMLTDYCTKGTISRDDENFARQISDGNVRWGNMSLYAVSKAMGFIPRNKLGHSFFKSLGDTETLDSDQEAKLLGKFLFNQMHILATKLDLVNQLEQNADTVDGRRSSIFSHLTSAQGENTVRLKDFFSAKEVDDALHYFMQDDAELYTPALSSEVSPGPLRAEGDTAHGSHRQDPSLDATVMTAQSDPNGMETAASGENEEGIVLSRDTFCPIMDPEMQLKAFRLFDRDGNGEVSKEEVIQAVVDTYKDHKSLAMTLQDSQHIARKLSHLIGAIIFFILIFVFLAIFGQDVMALSITFASFLVALAFMIGPSASHLMESIIHVFIKRPYDVGDRIFYYPHPKATVPENLVVAKIDLLMTKFRRWDEQVFYVPNYVLAKNTIINIQRSDNQWHEFFIQVAANTPSSSIWKLKKSCKDFAQENNIPRGLYPDVAFAMTNLEDSTKLTIRICFRQRSNWQDIARKWQAQSICINAIKQACEEFGIGYSLPEHPVTLKQKLR